MRASRLISLGSVNVDVQARAERWPEAGETLLARDFLMVGGGKAANVAYLARLLQADVQLVAHVGDDALADYALQPLRDLGIDFLHVKHVPNTATAVAMIVGRPDAQSSIVLANNANDAWTDDDHETVAAVITAAPAASVLVTDFEIPTRVVQRALHAAVRQGHKGIADPSPADRVPLDILPYVDYLTPNAGEAMRLTGIKVDSLDTAFAAAQCLHDRGAGMVLVKLSDGGCVAWGADIQEHIPSTGAQPVDTTGAGDAFAGALGVAILEQQPVRQALRFAVAAADHAVTQYGSQAAYPTRVELERRLIETGTYGIGTQW